MNLRETLDRLRQDQAASPRARAAIEATVDALRRNGATDQALGPGAAFPDFLLPDTEGRLVSRDDLLAGRAAVVTFFRGHWCPFCTATLGALLRSLPDFEEAGAGLAAITPETGGRARDARYPASTSYRILSDVDHGLAMACGVAIRVPEPYRELLSAHGLDLGERQGNAAWFLPVPATFVLDREGCVRWSFVDVDFTRRAEPADILRAIRAV